MNLTLRSLLLAGAVAVSAPTATYAADVTAAQAAQVETQLRDWLGTIVGPSVKIGDRPVQMTPAGDHFDVVAPYKLNGGTELRVTATARPLEGGKWAIEGVKTNTPLRFSMDMPIPPPEGSKAPPTTAKVDYVIEVNGQDGQLMLDPSFATPTTWTVSAKSVNTRASGGPVVQESRIGPTSTVTTIRPAGQDRVDVISDGTLQDYAIASRTEGLEAIQIGMRRVRVSANMTGISRTRAVTISQGMTTLIAAGLAAMPGMGGTGKAPEVAPELVRSLLGALQDFASEMVIDESFEGLTVKYGNYGTAMEKARLGLGAKSDGGLLQAHMDIGVEGLTLPDLPLGGMEVLIPKRVAFRPFVSGIGVPELMRMAGALSEKRDVAPADISAMFSHGGIVSGLESMRIELAGATFSGQGKITSTSPQDFTGAAQITAENFDGLMQTVSTMPALAQAVPVMAFVKGIGRTVDNRLIWDITYRDGRAMVNSVDLSAMMGGTANPAPPAGPPKSAPPRQQPRRQ